MIIFHDQSVLTGQIEVDRVRGIATAVMPLVHHQGSIHVKPGAIVGLKVKAIGAGRE